MMGAVLEEDIYLPNYMYNESEAFVPLEMRGAPTEMVCGSIFEWYLPTSCYDSEDLHCWDGDSGEITSDNDDDRLARHPNGSCES